MPRSPGTTTRQRVLIVLEHCHAASPELLVRLCAQGFNPGSRVGNAGAQGFTNRPRMTARVNASEAVRATLRGLVRNGVVESTGDGQYRLRKAEEEAA